jgi:glycosyltransferase involved in cell wall biosynthesis
VATDAGGIPETGIGIVTPSSGLANAMGQVVNMSPEARRRIGQSGRRIVTERYSIEVVVSRWEALYRTLLPST